MTHLPFRPPLFALTMLATSLALPAQAQPQTAIDTALPAPVVTAIPVSPVVPSTPVVPISPVAPGHAGAPLPTPSPAPTTTPTPTSVPVQNGKAGSEQAAPVKAPQPILAAPAIVNENKSAAQPPSPTLSDLGKSLRSYFTEDELDLLFQYMKESVLASFNDEEVNLPPDLSFKLEILLVRMKKEGGHYMDNLIDQMETDLKHKLKAKLTPPPIKNQPYNPWIPQPWQ